MRYGSLFTGVGGFDLGFERAGMACAWQVELSEYASRVLEKHWPSVQRWGDVRTFPTEPIENLFVDVICAGPPCQPISSAGHRKGANDERWMWGECLRVVATLRPKVFVAENPTNLLNDDRGRTFNAILGALSSVGYSCEWHVIPASAVGARHRRNRVWIVAHSDEQRRGGATHPRHCKEWAKRGKNLPEAVNLAAAGDKRWPPPPGSVIVFDDNSSPLPVCQGCLEPHGFTGPLNPQWVEWLMGFPIGWTDLGASATRSSRRSLKSSGRLLWSDSSD